MTFEKLNQAEELRDRHDALCEKLQDIMLMFQKADDCSENGEVWVAVGRQSSFRSMFIDADAVMQMLGEADARYSEKKREVEDEFAKL